MGRKLRKINPECGKRLKKWLHDADITAAALSAELYVTPQHISSIVTGKKRLTDDLAREIVDAAIKLNAKKVVRKEWLLCLDDFETEQDKIHSYGTGQGEVYNLITRLMQLHGYEIETRTFETEIDENGEYPVHCGIKAHDGLWRPMQSTEIMRRIHEIDRYIDFMFSPALNSTDYNSNRVNTLMNMTIKTEADNG